MSWGRFPQHEAQYFAPYSNQLNLLTQLEKTWIPQGLGRSYGDSALADEIVATTNLRYLIAFNEVSGELHCQSGVSLAEIIDVFLPRGWFLPVTPGTKWVTVGGAIASDVHGKNHHQVGCFSEFVDEITLLTAQGDRLVCSRQNHPEIFRATCGGMGLTGLILSAKIRLKKVSSNLIKQQIFKAHDLNETIAMLQAQQGSPYSVAWLDCLAPVDQLGRSVIFLGEHVQDGELTVTKSKTKNWPLQLMAPFLTTTNVKLFNACYYHLHQAKTNYVNLLKYFYPLDHLADWNRLYGAQGFTQYQFVLPLDQVDVLNKILAAIQQYGASSFLSVLKVFGKVNQNFLSFPMPGLTLALDFKISDKLWPFLNQLDQLVIAAGGRVYLTKDCRLSAENFRKMYPNWQEFLTIKQQLDPQNKIQSLQSKRLCL